MKFFVAALAVAAGVAAHKGHEGKNTTSVSGTGGSHVVYTTEVVTAYTTYCPFPTNITQGTVTYTVTEPTTLTITDCPCTIVTPVTTSTKVVCTDKESCSEKPPYPTHESSGSGGGGVNPTGVIPSKTGKPTEEPTEKPTKEPVTPVKPTATPPIATGAADKAIPALAGVVGLLAAVL